MRKILFLVLTGGIILFGCSKDSSNNASIIGTWNVNKVTAQIYINNVLRGSNTTTNGSVKFESNGSFTSTDSTGTYTGTYIYNSSSKQLTVIQDSDTSNATVTNLTSNNLHYTQDETRVSSDTTIRVTADGDYRR